MAYLSVPNTFVASTYAVAAEVNENFLDLYNALAGAKTDVQYKVDYLGSGSPVLTVNQSGTGDIISLTLSGVVKAKVTEGGVVSGTQLESTVAIGTPPLIVTSTDVVTNLNADSVDGIHDPLSGEDPTLLANVATTGKSNLSMPANDGLDPVVDTYATMKLKSEKEIWGVSDETAVLEVLTWGKAQHTTPEKVAHLWSDAAAAVELVDLADEDLLVRKHLLRSANSIGTFSASAAVGATAADANFHGTYYARLDLATAHIVYALPDITLVRPGDRLRFICRHNNSGYKVTLTPFSGTQGIVGATVRKSLGASLHVIPTWLDGGMTIELEYVGDSESWFVVFVSAGGSVSR